MSRMIFLDEQSVLERFIANKLAPITLIDKGFLRHLNHPLFSIVWMLVFGCFSLFSFGPLFQVKWNKPEHLTPTQANIMLDVSKISSIRFRKGRNSRIVLRFYNNGKLKNYDGDSAKVN